jgi:TIR domain
MLSNTQSQEAISIFYCYAYEDRKLRDELAKHLSNLRWQGLITEWHNFDISPGQEKGKEIAENLDRADIILLLISPDFMASYDCYEVEMKQAIARHRAKTARVIPIYLRPVDWENAPFIGLKVLPTGTKAVTEWHIRDRAYKDISEGIKRVVGEFLGFSLKSPIQPASKPYTGTSQSSFTIRPGYASSQILGTPGQSSQRSQPQSLSSNTFLQDAIDDPFSISSSSAVRKGSESWLHLRWFILATAIATGIVFAVGLIFPVIIDLKLWLIPWVVCLILGSIETNHFDQWYWFVGFTVFSPLTGLFYAVVHPVEKPRQLINLKQLIIMLLLLGYAMLVIALIINGTRNITLAEITAIMGALSIISAWLIRFLHKKHLGEADIIAFLFPAGLSTLDSQLNELDEDDNE